MEVKTRLTEALPGKVLLKTDNQYAASNNTYFTVVESDLKPAFIAQPTNAAEVGSLLKSLKTLLEQQNISVAIRGTGHTPFAGSANVADGVTVDMRGLKGITLSEDKSSVDIGVGENWASVYNELEKYGLTTAGGRVGRVGVGGLVLGGISNRPNLLKTLNNHSTLLVGDLLAIQLSNSKSCLHPAISYMRTTRETTTFRLRSVVA
jgi:hypothetical protein